jgi:signal transduction histidine kinase
MLLRTRLALVFLVLLVVPIAAMSVVALDYSIETTIDDLCRSADLLAQEIFDQMQVNLNGQAGNPATVLKGSASLRKLLDSSQAFGQGIVSASIIDMDREVILSAQGESEGKRAPTLRSIEMLRVRASGWLPFAAIRQFWTADVYELQHPVFANGRPLANISIGVSTALIADRLRHVLLIVLLTAGFDTLAAWILLSLVTNRIFHHLTRLARGFGELAEGESEVEIKLDGQEELATLTEKFNDLSRRVRTERAQLASHDHLFDIVRSIQDAIIMLDSSGAILFANPRARELLAPGMEKVEGEALNAMLGENHRLVELAASAMTNGTEAHDITIELPDGAASLATLFKLGRGRVPAGLLVLLRDLQPVIELETALDYSNRLARLGALISGVAHQLRSPLHSMNLRLELLRSDDGEGKDRHIERLRQEVERLDQSVEALLRFMRPETLKITDFDVNQLLRDLGSRIREPQVRVDYRLAESLPAVHGDRSMLSEALSNVITNAAQAMPKGGVLTLQTWMADQAIEVAVADTGIGIEQEQLDLVFNLYYTTKPHGTGLGLSLALRAIELNRGTIKIESRVAEGTTCRIKLPFATDAAPKDAPSNAA